MTNGRVTGVRSIELGVRNLQQSADFYTKAWALEEVCADGELAIEWSGLRRSESDGERETVVRLQTRKRGG